METYRYTMKVSNKVDSITRDFYHKGDFPDDYLMYSRALMILEHRLSMDLETPVHELATEVEIVERTVVS